MQRCFVTNRDNCSVADAEVNTCCLLTGRLRRLNPHLTNELQFLMIASPDRTYRLDAFNSVERLFVCLECVFAEDVISGVPRLFLVRSF